MFLFLGEVNERLTVQFNLILVLVEERKEGREEGKKDGKRKGGKEGGRKKERKKERKGGRERGRKKELLKQLLPFLSPPHQYPLLKIKQNIKFRSQGKERLCVYVCVCEGYPSQLHYKTLPGRMFFMIRSSGSAQHGLKPLIIVGIFVRVTESD
jgi:hypothetical protein